MFFNLNNVLVLPCEIAYAKQASKISLFDTTSFKAK